MKNKKLKSYVLPSLYACFFVGVLFVTIGIANVLTKKAPTNNTNEEINYVSESIVDDDEPVVKEENKILKPYTNDQVKIGKYYYDYKAHDGCFFRIKIYDRQAGHFGDIRTMPVQFLPKHILQIRCWICTYQ